MSQQADLEEIIFRFYTRSLYSKRPTIKDKDIIVLFEEIMSATRWSEDSIIEMSARFADRIHEI